MKSFCAAGANAQAFGASASANVAELFCLLQRKAGSGACFGGLGRKRVRAALEQLERLAQKDAAESVNLSARAATLLIVETKL